jgi:hypothetical protein
MDTRIAEPTIRYICPGCGAKFDVPRWLVDESWRSPIYISPHPGHHETTKIVDYQSWRRWDRWRRGVERGIVDE